LFSNFFFHGLHFSLIIVHYKKYIINSIILLSVIVKADHK